MSKPAVQQSKNGRDKNQSGDGRAKESSDHCSSQGSVLFATVAETQRHRNHADDHRQLRHDDGAKTGCTSFKRSGHGVAMM